MTTTKPLLVDCGLHGQRVAAVVCCHMVGPNRPPAGFVENSSDPSDLQAWCYECENMFEREGDKTAAFRSFNDMAVVCVVCYVEAKERHSLPGN